MSSNSSGWSSADFLSQDLNSCTYDILLGSFADCVRHFSESGMMIIAIVLTGHDDLVVAGRNQISVA
jgi:hypothetical protein